MYEADKGEWNGGWMNDVDKGWMEWMENGWSG